MKQLRCITVVVVIACIALLAWRWWPNDVRWVERRMHELFDVLTKNGPESLPVSVARSREAASYLASNVVLRLGEPFPSSMQRPDAMALLQQARLRVDRMTVKSRGHEIEILTGGVIRIDVTLDADVTFRGQRENILGTYQLDWTRYEGDWLISGANALEIIEHPAGSIW